MRTTLTNTGTDATNGGRPDGNATLKNDGKPNTASHPLSPKEIPHLESGVVESFPPDDLTSSSQGLEGRELWIPQTYRSSVAVHSGDSMLRRLLAVLRPVVGLPVLGFSSDTSKAS